MQEVAEAYPEVVALRARGAQAGESKLWTYAQLHADVQVKNSQLQPYLKGLRHEIRMSCKW